MFNEYDYIRKYKGYPKWDELTQEAALKMLYGFYVDTFGDDKLVEYLEEDLKWFESQQEYEVCTCLKDLIELVYEL